MTNKNYILKIDGLSHKDSIWVWHHVGTVGTWITWVSLFLNCDTQLANFSEIDEVKKHRAPGPQEVAAANTNRYKWNFRQRPCSLPT